MIFFLFYSFLLEYNSPEYFFDLGDCCLLENELECALKNGTAFETCPENPCIISNSFCRPEELGDGICQDHNNGAFCDYDMGDCCLPDTEDHPCCGCNCKPKKFASHEEYSDFMIALTG